MDHAPSMVQRSGDTLIVRRVVSGEQLILDQDGSVLENYIKNNNNNNNNNSENDNLSELRKEESILNQNTLPLPLTLPPAVVAALTLQHQQQQQQQSLLKNNLSLESINIKSSDISHQLSQVDNNSHKKFDLESRSPSDNESNLPQCKIKRNYSCNNCSFFTQNPRRFLTHLRDIHGEKIVINECRFCLYASRHYQKLVRHMKMVHGSTEGINEPLHMRRRVAHMKEAKKQRINSENNFQQQQQQQQQQQLFFGSLLSAGLNSVAEELSPINLSQQQHNLMLPSTMEQYIQQNLTIGSPSQSAFQDDMDGMDLSMNPQHNANGNKIFKCIICEFSTLNEDLLIKHEKDDHAKTKFFRCEKCSYVTHIKARYSKHVKYHSMPMIKCMMCDFRTPYKWNLDRHMKNHGGNGAFKCSICNFTADIKQSLTVHEMNHHVPPLGSNFSMKRSDDGSDVPGDDFYPMFAISQMQSESEQNFVQKIDESSNYSHNDSEPERVNLKRKKPIPDLIPLKSYASSSAMNLSKSKSDSDEREANEESPDEIQYKIISSLLNKKELSVESIYKSSGAGTSMNPETLALKKKNASFFDGLREKLINNSGETENLTCKCNYEAKSLSDLILHQKSCGKSQEKFLSPSSANKGNNLNSTRCQYCRHRCKSSVDLAAHLQNCSEAQSVIDCIDSSSDANGDDKNDNQDDYLSDEAPVDNPNERHPMENVVFVWNKIEKNPNESADQMDDKQNDDSDDNNLIISNDNDDDDLPETPTLQNSEYLGVESAPGYGEITKKIESGDELMNTAMKKVYKCPHCSFWASTASRFHVHIVGHLNKKPFECSLCAYRSNWRWDITKHIRLKLLRDPNHGDAKVLMNDETGRRNYSKYNKYVTLMRVVDKKHDGKLTKSGSVSSPFPSLNNSDNNLAISSSPSAASSSTPMPVFSEAMNLSSSANTSPGSHRSIVEAFSKDFCMNLLKNYQQNFGNPAYNLGNVVAQVINANLMQSDNSTLQQQQNEASSENQENKKTHFKCKKCNFKDSNRETVLEHVKTHYRENNNEHEQVQQVVELSPPPPIPFAINTALNQYLSTVTSSNNDSASNLLSGNNSLTSQSHIINIQSNPGNIMPVSNQTASPVVTATTSQTNTTTNVLERNGMTDQGSKGSFKCGHCGQVSNWKHVIQRHCRLKHNGDILIEVNGPKSEKSRHRQDYIIHNSTQMPSITTQMIKTKVDEPPITLIAKPKPVDNFKPIMLTSQPLQQAPTIINLTSSDHQDDRNDSDNHSKELLLASLLKVELAGDESNKMEIDLTSADPSQQLEVQNKSKRYKCNACPYETDSKSQFLHHKSFHKPRNESYQCKYCSYNVSKRHLLNQHIKMHQTMSNNEISNILHEENSNNPFQQSNLGCESILDNQPTSSEKLLHFCSICPARYLSLKEILQHFKMHMSPAHKNKCDHCTFSSTDDSQVKAHSAVHTTYYQEKTKEFIAKYKIAIEFKNPDLIAIKQSANERDAIEDVWVVKNEDPKGDDESGEHNDDDSNDVKFDEKCPYCPLQARTLDHLKDHLQHHYSVSNFHRAGKCVHCDYSDDDLERLKEHNKLHFSFICENNKNLDIFTSFCGLELSITKINNSNKTIHNNNNSNDNNNNNVNENDEIVIYKENDVKEFDDSKNEKIIIDV